MNSVGPDEVGLGDHLVGALGVDEHLDARAPRPGRASTPSAVNRPCTEQWPFHRIIRAAASCSPVSPPSASRGSHTTQSSSDSPSCEHRGVAAQVLVGEEQDLGVGAALGEGPLERDVGVARGAHRAAVAAAEGLDVGRGVHVGHRDDRVGDAGVDQGVPRVLDLGEPGHVGHRAAGGQVGQDHLLVVRGEDVGRLGHEVDAAEDDVLRLRARRRLPGQLERVAGDVGELDDLVALVVVTEHEDPIAQRGLGGPGALDQGRVGRRRAGSRGTPRPARRSGRMPLSEERRQRAGPRAGSVVMPRIVSPTVGAGRDGR